MCGIAGIIQFDASPIPETWREALAVGLQHRGPDGEGRFCDKLTLSSGKKVQIALVHTRLAIIDPETGIQPMLSSTGVVARDDGELVSVVFNGCIYNHRELRRELEGCGHTFQTDHSDTEVILRGYQQWGGDGGGGDGGGGSGGGVAQHLDGMFAFAVYDRGHRSITLVRDRVGEKPLYYWCGRASETGTIIFASTIPAIQAVIALMDDCPTPAAWREGWHFGFLARGYCAPAGLPDGDIQLLRPGHSLCIDLDGGLPKSPTAYWKPERLRNSVDAPGADFEALLRGAVYDRLEADAPLGCFLSGGIDSSLIAKFALERKPDLKTYCVRMPDPRYDESAIAAEVAKHLHADHTTLEIDQSAAADDLVHLIGQLGHPFADSSILPTYWVAKAARDHVKVALSGDGGDELFLGYERFQAAGFLQRYRALLRLIPAWPMSRFHPKSKCNKLARLAGAARGLGYADLTTFFDGVSLLRLDAEYGPPTDSIGESIEAAQEFEFSVYLPDDLLRKVDTATMAVALEVRAPFLATILVEAALATPVEQLMPGGERKGILKNMARRFLPEKIVNRPKMGFAIPLGEWFRTDYGNLRTLLEDQLNSIEPFGDLPLNLAYCRQLMNEHLEGRRDHTHRLFALLVLAIWAQRK